MYPHERSLVKELADKPFALIGVNNEEPSWIQKVVKEKNINWRSFQDKHENGRISDDWAIRSWPAIFVLDAEGKIRYKDVRGNSLDDAITKLLAELGVVVDLSLNNK